MRVQGDLRLCFTGEKNGIHVETNMVTIEVPEDLDEKQPLQIVRFSHGNLQPSALQKIKFTLYNKASDRTKKRRIVVAESKQLSYLGTNFDKDNIYPTTSGVCKYYIGEVDRTTQTLRLHKAECISMTPCIPGKTHEEIVTAETQAVATEEELGSSTSQQNTPIKLATPVKVKLEDQREIHREMVSSFGSERQKRALAAVQRNKVEAASLNSSLSSALEQYAREKEGSSDSVPFQGSALIPAHNPNAQSPGDVYDVNSIISVGEFKALKKVAKTITNATPQDLRQWRKEKLYAEFVLEHISQLPPSEPEGVRKACVVLYANFLIQLYQSNPRTFERKGPIFTGIPPPSLVVEQLLSKFTDQKVQSSSGATTQVLSHQKKEKMLSHLCALALVLSRDFVVDCATLQKDLMISVSKLANHFRALGCAVSRQGQKRSHEGKVATDALPSCTATLKIPLSFPKRRQGRKKSL